MLECLPSMREALDSTIDTTRKELHIILKSENMYYNFLYVISMILKYMLFLRKRIGG